MFVCRECNDEHGDDDDDYYDDDYYDHDDYDYYYHHHYKKTDIPTVVSRTPLNTESPINVQIEMKINKS